MIVNLFLWTRRSSVPQMLGDRLLFYCVFSAVALVYTYELGFAIFGSCFLFFVRDRKN